MPVKDKRLVKELKIYTDGTIEETSVHRSEYKAPDWEQTAMVALAALGIAALGALVYYMVVKGKSLTETVEGAKSEVSSVTGMKFSSPVPQPMVSVDQFAMPLNFSGRWVG